MTTYRGRIITYDSHGLLKDFDGYITVENGKIKKVSNEKSGEYVDYSDYLILPGFIDTHIHLPQIAIRGKWNDDLLHWLEKYVFPEEKKFLDLEYAEKMTLRFFEELVRNGTTTAMIYGPSSRESTDLAFEISERYGVRVFMGQTLMDMNVPQELITPVDKAVEDVKSLADKWQDRYVLTLRFAPSCSFELMRKTAKIARERNLRIQTHISEQINEMEMVRKIFGDGYTNVYDRAGVLYHRTVLAHGIYLNDDELRLISERRAKIAHCPSSNFFLHSGIMKMEKVKKWGIDVSLGSDVAGGAYINMLSVMRDAYYANPLSPSEIFRLATMDCAKVLGIDDITGTIEAGKDADFIVVKPFSRDKSAEETLAELIFFGGEQNIVATYIRGKMVWSRI